MKQHDGGERAVPYRRGEVGVYLVPAVTSHRDGLGSDSFVLFSRAHASHARRAGL